MVYGIYQSAGGMQVNQYRMDVLANNLANVQTPGFKHDLTLVRERLVASQEEGSGQFSNAVLDEMTGGSLVAPTVTVFQQGALEETDGKLDAAIEGEGFFTVKAGKETQYTRDGRFAVDSNGTLVTATGHHAVLNDEGQPITVTPAASGQVRINADGSVQAGKAVLGTLKMVSFEDTSQLVKTGGGLFKAVDIKPTATQPTLRPGMIERSTVDPTASMVSMIEISRSYQMNATMVGLSDQTLSRAVNDIAKLR